MGGLAHHFEEHAHACTPWHRLDARVKLLLLVAFTVAAVTTRIERWPAFAVYAAMVATAAAVGRFPLVYLLKRMSAVLPFIAMAAAFLPFQAGASNHGSGAAYPSGLALFLNFTVKSALGAAASVLVTASTPFPQLAAALETLRAPRVMVMIFSFTYRYLFALVEEAQRMMRARDSRCYRGRSLRDVPAIGQMIGTLFLRSYERGERVYLAMLSRCYEGPRAQAPEPAALRTSDIACLASGGALLFAIWTAAQFAG